ncbi:hypothetical protein [Trinickia dinghuensis]|uniref:DUF1190 domain-containing protein n=1 Tax=Trinickia dinghuensis TaxID=2291023 RepID=A0A3D8JYS2_9BURK|nr:hypothetical protein [Trinickia dinghuensis]RDU97774.1 hypothetical protein DWV00_18140 [Trinickia dinghuensis]
MQNKRSPRLVLVGSAIATAGLLNACHDSAGQTTHVLRNGYATQQECIDDWGPVDCTYIDSGAAGASAASAASPASGTSSANTGGVYVGSGFHYFGPYYTRRGIVYHENGMTSTRANPPIVRQGTTTEFDVRNSELHAGSDAFHRAPSVEEAHETHAISRGGFLRGSTSMHEGSHFHSGFHGSHGG